MRQIKVLRPTEAIQNLPISCLRNPELEDLSVLEEAGADLEKFIQYLKTKLLPDWQLVNELTDSKAIYQVARGVNKPPPQLAIIVAKHYDKKSCGLVVDAYQIFLWTKDYGAGISNIFKTDLHHPNHQEEYILDIRLEIEIKASTDDFLIFNLSLINDSQPWYDCMDLLFFW